MNVKTYDEPLHNPITISEVLTIEGLSGYIFKSGRHFTFSIFDADTGEEYYHDSHFYSRRDAKKLAAAKIRELTSLE